MSLLRSLRFFFTTNLQGCRAYGAAAWHEEQFSEAIGPPFNWCRPMKLGSHPDQSSSERELRIHHRRQAASGGNVSAPTRTEWHELHCSLRCGGGLFGRKRPQI